jgi:hypothetical protein
VLSNKGWVVGYRADDWSASAWILHAMYETATLPEGLSHDEGRRIQKAAGLHPGYPEGGLNVAGGQWIGNPLGRSRHPGSGWERLRWEALEARMNLEPVQDLPGYDSFPIASWPVNVRPPGEGSLDREQFLRLLDHLAGLTVAAGQTHCLSLYAAAASGDYDNDPPEVSVGTLDELRDLYDAQTAGSPSNFWPEDRSWFVWTSPDLWGTKVSGPQELIDSLQKDNQLEVRAITC